VREKTTRLLATLLLGCLSLTALADLEPLPLLEMQDRHPTISRNVTKLIEDIHYSNPTLDNSLSSAIFDRYMDMLDGSRIYFLASDVASIGRYRYQLDDRAKSGDLEPVFDVFNLFRERTRQRIEYALELLETRPDFTVDEEYVLDRSEMPWPVTEEEMREVWRKRVKFDALNEMLSRIRVEDEPGTTDTEDAPEAAEDAPGAADAADDWADTVETLRERYETIYKNISQLTENDAFDTFMNAIASTIDPHSTYLSPRQSEEYRIQMSLEYDGIGASLRVERDYVTVIEIIPGGPAQADGRLKPDDRIVGISEGDDGEFINVVGWRLDEVVERIRGPGGTVVRLQILPAGAQPGSETVLALTRDKIKLEESAAKSELMEVDYQGHTYRVGVIDVPSFYQNFAARSRGDEDYTSTSRDVARLIRELEQEGIDGLVMDLRQNGGGHLTEATELSGLFIDEGPVVQVRETRGSPQRLDDPNPGSVYDGPLAVLVDRYSASASEIFAAAIQDYQRGVIIGQRTFGKGTVQNLLNLDRWIRSDNNGQLTLTIGKYYRITGESTQHRGVIPDIELPSIVDEETVGESTRETALPWDRIQPTVYKPLASLDSEITVLRQHLAARVDSDPDLSFLLSDVEAIRQRRNRESVSLNLEKRLADIDQLEASALERENHRRTALGLDPVDSLDELESTDSPESILLRQATHVVAEMAAFQAGGGEIVSDNQATTATSSSVRPLRSPD
jgi:carboxyl-terminal processing protease